MKTIGVIGTGFVGNAVIEGMKHAFDICAYDKKYAGVRRTIRDGIDSTFTNGSLNWMPWL